MAVPLARQQAVQLGAREDEQSVGRRWRAAEPVIGDREHVVPRPLVVLDERAGSELAVRIRSCGHAARSGAMGLRPPGSFIG